MWVITGRKGVAEDYWQMLEVLMLRDPSSLAQARSQILELRQEKAEYTKAGDANGHVRQYTIQKKV
jgi:hypothetical protein